VDVTERAVEPDPQPLAGAAEEDDGGHKDGGGPGDVPEAAGSSVPGPGGHDPEGSTDAEATTWSALDAEADTPELAEGGAKRPATGTGEASAADPSTPVAAVNPVAPEGVPATPLRSVVFRVTRNQLHSHRSPVRTLPIRISPLVFNAIPSPFPGDLRGRVPPTSAAAAAAEGSVATSALPTPTVPEAPESLVPRRDAWATPTAEPEAAGAFLTPPSPEGGGGLITAISGIPQTLIFPLVSWLCIRGGGNVGPTLPCSSFVLPVVGPPSGSECPSKGSVCD